MPVKHETRSYQSDYEGKEKFVEEKLEPLILAMNDGWKSVKYYRTTYSEFVGLTHNNPDKSIEVNVSCDSLSALVKDVFRALNY